ncbi:MAG TPA: PP2C family protein-serine/threonine phosphatase [Thermoanaerobaculia bacterium]|nr:PP2C family protein-serine/threonine phosphatase [Thermoanaerobaculia bacterium]
MKRLVPLGACVVGIILLAVLIPRFNTAQPMGISVTRDEAHRIADVQARELGIPVDKAWTDEVWVGSPLLDRELDPDPARRLRANADPVIGPRLGGHRINYFRRGADKFTPYGYVYLDHDGRVIATRVRYRPEDPGGKPTEAELQPVADAFVRSRVFPGAPSPQFEGARPNVLRKRTDWIFRYRVPSSFAIGNIVPYLYVHYAGGKLAGWELIEEYADGSTFRGDAGGIATTFIRFICIYGLLLVLLIIFLKKYHAGEVGVGTASGLFAATVLLWLVWDFLAGAAAADGSGMGNGIDAQQTALTVMGFKFLFFDLPMAVVVFFAWAVGESYARERWGHRLASFDAILRRDPFNATVGRSVLTGILYAPAMAAAAFLIGLIPIALRLGRPAIGPGTESIIGLGGPAIAVIIAGIDALLFSVIGVLFILAACNRRRLLPLGILLAAIFALIMNVGELPLDPNVQRMLFSFGAGLAGIGIFLAYDLLATAVATFGASLLIASLPLASVARGSMLRELLWTIAVPLVVVTLFAIAARLTGREVVYTYEDLAPHVKRIIERERVKAEIDAANRIQAALLPLDTPSLAGASVASHYRAATEIGGDYFDFLPQPSGEIGIAFGDVSGHGLTSGIVMAMAKAALLVQVDNDPSPRAVLTVLNNIVMKTAPKRILMTFFFGLLDPRAQQLRFSSAGHLDPYVYRAEGRRLEALSSWGFPLGVRRRDPFQEHTVDFAAGDRLILYSDGLIEAVDDDGEPFGFERFEKTLLEHGRGSADDIKKALLASIRKFTRNRPPEDDQTLVVVSFDEIAAARVVPRVGEMAVSETVN